MDVTCHIFPAPFFVIDADSDYNRTFLSGVSDTVYWIWFYADGFRNTRFKKRYDVICHFFPAPFFVIDVDYNRTFLSGVLDTVHWNRFYISQKQPILSRKRQDARKKAEIWTWHVTSFRLHFLSSMHSQIITGHFERRFGHFVLKSILRGQSINKCKIRSWIKFVWYFGSFPFQQIC